MVLLVLAFLPLGQECHGRGALSQSAAAAWELRESGSGRASPVYHAAPEEAEPQPSPSRPRP